jgi:3-methyladenine DNA glycosylase AlkC
LGLNAKAAIFIQKATLAAMNKISKIHFLNQFKAKHPNLVEKMVDAYKMMI